VIDLPEFYEAKERNFPRFAKDKHPRCPNHGQEMQPETHLFPNFPAVLESSTFQEQFWHKRKTYRCAVKGCHFVAASEAAQQETQEWVDLALLSTEAL
jgi:hypothetical protein